MNQFFKYFLASLLALVIGIILFFIMASAFIGGLASSFGSKEKKSKATVEKSILHIDLNKSYNEIGSTNILAALAGEDDANIGLYDILNAIKTAKNDDKIKGIYIKAGATPNGMATLEQIRAALKDFKSGNKFIYAYGDYLSQRDYYVVSVADSIFVNPLGTVELKGLGSSIAFFKGTLDKLDINPEIFYCGQFKSATEPFRADKMSEPNRLQIKTVQNDMWQNVLVAISEHTNATQDEIHNWAYNLTIQNASDAIQYKLIEGIKYKDEVEDILRSATATNKDKDVPFISIADYNKPNFKDSKDGQIAVLVGEGQIVDGSSTSSNPEIASDDMIKEIRKIKENNKIKAVVLRINSPGGSALASENILRELRLLREKKPIVVSMSDLAASGGYYIAMAGDSIFASHNTITGSIGVFGMMFNTKDFFNKKLGVTFDVEKNTPYGDFPNLTRTMTDSEKIFIQNSVDSIYLTFKTRVTEGRKNKDNFTLEYVDSVGQGRIWTGTTALQLGLVDAIGSLDRAIESAATIAGISDYKVTVLPKSEDKFEAFIKMIGGSSNVSQRLITEQFLQTELGDAYNWYKLLSKTPQRGTHHLMMMPYSIEIK